jgi:predicted MFS family arabinose efflux permease
MTPPDVSSRARYVVLAACFLGWLFAGIEMSLMPLAARPVAQDMLGAGFKEADAGKWLNYFNGSLLLGAAFGGLIFGWMGDRFGRVRAMAWSILCYSGFTGLGYFTATPEQMSALRFLAGLGVGGMWPCAVSLLSEFWADVSRPKMAGILACSANIGYLLVGLMGAQVHVTPNSWRWLMLVGGAPVLLGVCAMFVVPESPKWLATRATENTTKPNEPVAEIFRPPLLRVTIVGFCLAAIPLLGAWSSGKFLMPWADSVATDAGFKARTQMIWGGGAALGSLLGGVAASLLGRRLSYFLISLGAFALNAGIYRFASPRDGIFLPWVFVLGFVSTLFFGWLPLFLPELFPTRVRATGTGVSYNFGRFTTAAGVFVAGALMSRFGGDYAKVGAVTSCIYALGVVVIWLAPETTGKELKD